MISALFRCLHSEFRPRRRFGGGRRLGGVTVQPFRHVVMEELLAPDHSGEGLTLDRTGVGVRQIALQLAVELFGLASRWTSLVESLEPGGRLRKAESGPDHVGFRARHGHMVPRAGLGPGAGRVHDCLASRRRSLVEPVLEVPARCLDSVEAGDVGLVLGEEQRGRPVEMPAPFAPAGSSAVTVPASASSRGRAMPSCHDQVFRNQSWGIRCSSAASGPRLCAVIRRACLPGRPWRTRSRCRNSGRRRRCRCPPARTPARRRRVGRFSRHQIVIGEGLLRILVQHPEVGVTSGGRPGSSRAP